MSEKITKNSKISEVIMRNPEIAGTLLEAGLGCIGCPMAQMETIEQGCKAHGMSGDEVEKLVDELNKKSEEKPENKKE